MWWSGLAVGDVVATLRRLEPRTYVLALAIHVGIYALRARRFQQLVPAHERPPLGEVITASAAHNLAAQVLPAKTGEVTLVVYLRGRSGVSGSAAAASLLTSRLLDVLMLAAFGGVAAAFAARDSGAVVVLLAVLLLAAALAGAFAFSRATRLTGAVARWCEPRGGGAARAGAVVERLGAALETAGTRASLLPAALLSLPLWVLVFAFWVVLAADLGLPPNVGALDSAFAAALASLASLLPLAAFGGIGPMEAGWQLGYGLVGVDLDTALAVGLAVHLVQLFNVAVLGGIAHLRMAQRPGRSERPRDVSAP